MYWSSMPESPVPRPSSVGSTQSGSNVSTKATSSRGKNDFCVGEELKIAVNIALERFRLSEDQKELEFPSSFTSSERAYIHKLSQSYGLKSKSKGKGSSRFLAVTKKDGALSIQSTATFHLVRSSRQQIYSLLQRCPLTAKERQELQQRIERNQYNEGLMKEMGKTTTGRLNNGVPQVPPSKAASELTAFQQGLPVYTMRDAITRAVNESRVLMVAGETGSGKTTQVPQMILDDCHAHNKPCRIFCTQPRRLSALSVAERVATERGEKIGQTVGYQIRLESRVSPKTLLTFCTNGVLLRTLMAGEQSLATVTHVIVDEIHERDRFSDFLLIVLRDVLPKMKNLKLILMSAALNTQLFSTYFGGCPIITVPGRLFDVDEYFLEDVLKWTKHSNKDMEKCRQELDKASLQKNLDEWCSRQMSKVSVGEDVGVLTSASNRLRSDMNLPSQECLALDEGSVADAVPEREDLEPQLVQGIDQLLTAAWLTGNEDIFAQIFHLILNENVSVDYVHSETSVTPLMVAAGRGFLGVVEQLLNMGASVAVRSINGWQAIDWAQKYDQLDVLELIEAHVAALEQAGQDETVLVKQSSFLSQDDKDLLSVYHHSIVDDRVDVDLIISLLYKIHCKPQNGAILVFLPGYDEIISLRDRIQEDERFSDGSRYILYLLHSQMQSPDQKRAFKNPGPGIRKIILSTNIAETCITINDVVFVIDSGKVKEKSYDALTSVSMLKSHWISKASSVQRKGRAGRCCPGVVYRLYSRVRFEGMQEFQDPEILRFPLQELCLHTKLLAPSNCLIADFLAKAPEPPAFLITRNAVHLLKQIDALDPFEDLTELGHHLADLPVEPRYGKMILYSVVLKCLDPILTIACALAYKDPFLLPSQPYQKRAAAMSRRKFAAGTFSDHMALLRAFQGWQKARAEGWERSFCEKNLLSFSTMEMIVGMRTQLLGQLRASGFVRARGGGDIRDLNSNSENWAVVKAALCAGMYPNIVHVDRERCQLTTAKESKVRFHSASILGPAPNEVGPNNHSMAINRLPTDWVAFEEMTRMRRMVQVWSCTVVSPVTVALFAGPAKLPLDAVRDAENAYHHASAGGVGDGSINNSSDSEGEDKDDGTRAQLRLDDWIAFRLDPDASALIVQLRQKWHSLFLRRMRSPTKLWSQFDESTIRTVVAVLTNEEQALGLQQPAGIGQRPRPMSTETVVSCGGSRRGSCDEPVASGADENGRGNADLEGRLPANPMQRTSGKNGDGDNKSEASSGPSSNSTSGSNSNSRKGSATSSPRESPQPLSSHQRSPFEGGTTPGSPSASCYFIMKASNNKILVTSEEKGLWATATSNEKKISKAFKENKTVYLIFSIQGSNYFQGIARVAGPVTSEKVKEFHAPGLGGTFPVQWIRRTNISFQQCQHLVNSWNENKKVIASRDGQEIEPSVGEQLLRLWDKPPSSQYAPPVRFPPGSHVQVGSGVSHGGIDYSGANRGQSGHHGNPYSAWSPNQKSYGQQWSAPGSRRGQPTQVYPGGGYPVVSRMEEMNVPQMGAASVAEGHQYGGHGYIGQFPKGYVVPASTQGNVMIMQRSTADSSSKNSGTI